MTYQLGVDVGSTTVKTVLQNENGDILYSCYQRHLSKTRETTALQLQQAAKITGEAPVKLALTGSAGMGIAQDCALPFVQEVFAAGSYIKDLYPQVSAAVELGGEDAKIIFLDGTMEERMNSTCAGGTGAFIDQMATLLHVTPEQLDDLSLKATDKYPIASRCGVFAKTDIQPLINQGAKKEDIAASIFQAVVDQTITGLAQGRPIRGNVLFLGGPLSFLKGLQQCFVQTLPQVTPVFPPMAQYFVALGAAHYAAKATYTAPISVVLEKLANCEINRSALQFERVLFTGDAQYREFLDRHSRLAVKTDAAFDPDKPYYLGIDAGSTTTKLVVLNSDCAVLYSHYCGNNGNPVDIVKEQLGCIYTKFPQIRIAGSAVTGYGEDLIRSAFHADCGLVETVAHFTAARYFDPKVDYIIDIGGQDMKCFGIKNGSVDSVILNEACSSGCGSFIETFATSLGYSAPEFAKLGLFAAHPVDLGSRCTVFMNSSVKQAQKNGAQIGDISAGLAISVVKNALYKVLRVSDASLLGEHVVVQGGTFLNDAVLRAFEMLLGREVTRPNIAGLMGAFGAALHAMRQAPAQSTLLNPQQLSAFCHTSSFTHCGLCQNHCGLTVNRFGDGRTYLSGNRCERPTGKVKPGQAQYNLYAFKQQYLQQMQQYTGSGITVGLPMVLNFYDTLPLWFTFFKELGVSVVVSGPSSRKLYQSGQHTIPSDTVCYGAKLCHGHIISLCSRCDAVFYPRMSYNFNEHIADNCFHCPVVAYYPEVIVRNVPELSGTRFIDPYIALNDRSLMAHQLQQALAPLMPELRHKRVHAALEKGFEALQAYRQALWEQGEKALAYARENHVKTIVLAGRPYHADAEINHGIDRLISSLGFVVLTEDSLPPRPHERGVLNQWSYHARMYSAAEAVCTMPDTELVQLISFGCGLDAVTSDEIREILESHGKLYTGLKIDEINNLGAVKIRIRSLLAAMESRA